MMWIPKETARPYDGQKVLAYTNSGCYFVLPYYHGFNRSENCTEESNDDTDMTDSVLYWAPLVPPVLPNA